ncbi:MAG: hypothetical protein HUU19_10335 [Phycisphaerales bacterium]|nr:hypothetical protein [Phycisphaerales bacterium]
MSHQAQQTQASNEFDAAKVIVETLKGLDKQQQARAIKFACEALEIQPPVSGAASHGGSAPLTPATISVPTATDIKQFTASKAPKSDQQFAAVVAYFHRFVAPEAERKDAINAEDLKDAARKVGRKRPHRVTLNNAKNAGYLDAAERGSFKINTVGENLVAVTLPGNGGEGGSIGRGRSRAKPGRKPGSTRKKRRSR